MKTFKEYASVKSTDGAHVDEDGNLMDLTDDSVIEKLPTGTHKVFAQIS